MFRNLPQQTLGQRRPAGPALSRPRATSRITPRRIAASAILGCTAGLLAACGSSSPSAHPTVTVTVTVPAPPPTTAPASSPATTPPGPAGCATTALMATLGAPGGAAGSTYYPIEFTNTSSSTCSLYGYPGVSFVTASGSQIGAAATEDPTFPRRLVTLAPGVTAHAELRVTDAANYSASTCRPVTAHQLKIYPPGQTSSLGIALTATGCANSSVLILAVQTVQPGKTGP
jgi:hypothetical protein